MGFKMPSAEKEKCVEAMDVMKDWDTWLDSLRQGMDLARGVGISEEELKEMSRGLLDYITEEFCPATEEEEILRDMWNVATPKEKKSNGRHLL